MRVEDMPEMPEIETIARKLRKSVLGKRIEGIRLSGQSLRRPIPDSFIRLLKGRTVRRVLRRGKYIVVELQPKIYWLLHLGMSGRLLYHTNTFRQTSHTHAVIRFSDASSLEFRDPRRFGLLDVCEASRPQEIPVIRGLGEEPLGKRFDGRWLHAVIVASRQELKSFLLDQRRVAGLGNIYVCEALFEAGLHPARRCHTLSEEEAFRLASAIKDVLRRAVRRRGTSFSDFIDLDGNTGKNQMYLKVFQREGDACVRCGDPILRLRQGNRSTFFCAGCQR
jgi:formamidopyrimidine-DNA glycosylase